MKKLIPLLLLALACRNETKTTNYPNAPVILISIDTLRADHLPAYGYKSNATPNIDRLRNDGILFTHAYSHVPLTLPSHVSILTGELPPDNGVRNNVGFPFDATKHPTLPQLLKQNGYATGAAVSAYVLRGNTGLASAFDAYDDDIAVQAGEALGRLRRPGNETEAVAERWIDAHAQQPFFYFFHIFEPHSPYESYDRQIEAADAIVGKLLEHLREKGIYDRAIIVLLSDHGEGLNQHGEEEHGIFLYMEDIHVPLIVKLPSSARAQSTIEAPAQLIDVFPTIASLTGIAHESKGASLFDIANRPPRRIYSETLYPRIHLGWSDLRSMVDEKFHFIDAPRAELYATSEPAETRNVLGDERRVAAAMRKELEPFSREMPSMESIDPEVAKKLGALGYLGSAAGGPSGGALPDPKDGIEQVAMLKDAAHLDQQGRTAEAIDAFKRVIALNARLTDAWTLLAQLYERHGRYEEALDTYKRCAQVAPVVAGELALSIANVDLLLNRFDDAIANAELGMKVNPGNAHLIAGRAKLNLGRLADAAADARAAMETFNYKPAGLVLLAQIDVRQRRLPEALREVEMALEAARASKLDPPPLLYYVRGDILARMNQIPAAIDAFNEEIRRYPNDRQAYANLAVIYLLQGDRARANETMERLVRANPDRRSYELAATTFAELHDEEDARRWRAR